jgi:NCAIR mutase (PurE)-related protein
MTEDQLRGLIQDVKDGNRDIDAVVSALRAFPYEDLGYARIDHHRALRKGFPEVVFCEGKTETQVVEILQRLSAQNPRVMATRANANMFATVQAAIPNARYFEPARIISIENTPRESPGKDEPYILVASAGTVDIPVAEEAAVTAEILGSRVKRVYDVGVAGLHRLLAQRTELEHANVVVAVAGMDGVMPTIIAGLVECPVIAVPTSVGYGTGLGGIAAVLAMLNSCAAGITVVNIDNGFGAGWSAHLVNERNRSRVIK